LFFLFPALLAACQLLVGIDEDRFTVVRSSAPEASADAGTSLPDLCAHHSPPSRPEAGAIGENRTFVLAIDSYRLDDSTAGFDLDGVCTCDPLDRSKGAGQPTCIAPAKADASCDGDGGIDNALGRAVESLRPLINVSEMFDRQVACGGETLLIVISDYNGEADDIAVKVSVIETVGLFESSDGGASTDAATGCVEAGPPTFPPRRDGTDRWDVPPGATTPGSRTEISGWVKNFHLALDNRRSTSTLPFYFGRTLVTLSGVVMTGQLVPLGAAGETLPVVDGRIQGGPAKSFRLERATLAGRLPARQVVVGAGQLRLANGFACTIPEWSILKPLICDAVDSVHDIGLDLTSQSCDAISVGMRFEAVPALVGKERPRSEESPCGPKWAEQVCP